MADTNTSSTAERARNPPKVIEAMLKAIGRTTIVHLKPSLQSEASDSSSSNNNNQHNSDDDDHGDDDNDTANNSSNSNSNNKKEKKKIKKRAIIGTLADFTDNTVSIFNGAPFDLETNTVDVSNFSSFTENKKERDSRSSSSGGEEGAAPKSFLRYYTIQLNTIERFSPPTAKVVVQRASSGEALAQQVPITDSKRVRQLNAQLKAELDAAANLWLRLQTKTFFIRYSEAVDADERKRLEEYKNKREKAKKEKKKQQNKNKSKKYQSEPLNDADEEENNMAHYLEKIGEKKLAIREELNILDQNRSKRARRIALWATTPLADIVHSVNVDRNALYTATGGGSGSAQNGAGDGDECLVAVPAAPGTPRMSRSPYANNSGGADVNPSDGAAMHRLNVSLGELSAPAPLGDDDDSYFLAPVADDSAQLSAPAQHGGNGKKKSSLFGGNKKGAAASWAKPAPLHDFLRQQLRKAPLNPFALVSSSSPTTAVTSIYGPVTRERVAAFYRRYNPGKVMVVDATMKRYAGREVELMESLIKKYGPEPPMMHHDHVPDENTPCNKACADDPDPLAAVISEPIASSSPLLPAGPNPFRQRLYIFYQRYNPEKLAEVDSILEEFRGSEEQMFQHLVEKYGPEPGSAAAPSDAATPRETLNDVVERRINTMTRGEAREIAGGGLTWLSHQDRPRKVSATSVMIRLMSRLLNRLFCSNIIFAFLFLVLGGIIAGAGVIGALGGFNAFVYSYGLGIWILAIPAGGILAVYGTASAAYSPWDDPDNGWAKCRVISLEVVTYLVLGLLIIISALTVAGRRSLGRHGLKSEADFFLKEAELVDAGNRVAISRYCKYMRTKKCTGYDKPCAEEDPRNPGHFKFPAAGFNGANRGEGTLPTGCLKEPTDYKEKCRINWLEETEDGYEGLTCKDIFYDGIKGTATLFIILSALGIFFMIARRIITRCLLRRADRANPLDPTNHGGNFEDDNNNANNRRVVDDDDDDDNHNDGDFDHNGDNEAANSEVDHHGEEDHEQNTGYGDSSFQQDNGDGDQ